MFGVAKLRSRTSFSGKIIVERRPYGFLNSLIRCLLWRSGILCGVLECMLIPSSPESIVKKFVAWRNCPKSQREDPSWLTLLKTDSVGRTRIFSHVFSQAMKSNPRRDLKLHLLRYQTGSGCSSSEEPSDGQNCTLRKPGRGIYTEDQPGW